MTREHDSRSQGQQHPRGDDGGGDGPARDPRILQIRRMAHAASVYNKAHPELAAEFTKLTGIDGKSVRAVRAWQLRHGQRGDGKIGPKTVEAARAEAKQSDSGASAGGGAAVVSFSDEEAGSIEVGSEGSTQGAAADGGDLAGGAMPARIGPEPAEEEDGLAGELVARGSTASQKHRPKEDPDEAEAEGGKAVGEAAEKGLEGAAGEGAKGAAVSKAAAVVARMPHVIHLMKEKKYKEAADYIYQVLGYEDKLEILKLVAEHMGIPLAEIAEAAPLIGTIGRGLAVAAGTVDIVLIGVEFQKEALEALAKAREEGERDNLIYLYSSAWAHSFLWGAGSYSNPGAIDERQQQAVADGNREGALTAGGVGERAAEIGKKLIAEYGTPENAEKALVDALLKRAGIEGVRFHGGKERKHAPTEVQSDAKSSERAQ